MKKSLKLVTRITLILLVVFLLYRFVSLEYLFDPDVNKLSSAELEQLVDSNTYYLTKVVHNNKVIVENNIFEGSKRNHIYLSLGERGFIIADRNVTYFVLPSLNSELSYFMLGGSGNGNKIGGSPGSEVEIKGWRSLGTVPMLIPVTLPVRLLYQVSAQRSYFTEKEGAVTFHIPSRDVELVFSPLIRE